MKSLPPARVFPTKARRLGAGGQQLLGRGRGAVTQLLLFQMPRGVGTANS